MVFLYKSRGAVCLENILEPRCFTSGIHRFTEGFSRFSGFTLERYIVLKSNFLTKSENFLSFDKMFGINGIGYTSFIEFSFSCNDFIKKQAERLSNK